MRCGLRAGVRVVTGPAERDDARGGKPMISANQTSASDVPPQVPDQVDEAALAEVMRVVPLGAGVLAGTAVALLVLGYLAIYLLIFLPRGPVG
jgi:hypothetical protein